MKRTIRLTESEFHSLVRRLVIEAEEEMNKEDETEVVQDVIDDVIQDQVAQEDLSYDDIMTMISRLERIQNKIESNETLSNMDLDDVVDAIESNEGGEMGEGLDARMNNRKKALKTYGGIGLGLAGILAMMSQGTTYIEWGDTFIAIHDGVKAAFGQYAPNVGLASTVGGIILALNGAAMEKQEEEKEIQKESYRRNYRRNYRR